MINKYYKGAEWRRWDLHIHTKDTFKNDQFASSNFNTFCLVHDKNYNQLLINHIC